MRQAEQQVVLVDATGPSVSIHLSAWTDEQGLVLEGQDLGPTVESVWGDSDYEYWLSVERKHLDRVSAVLASELDREVQIADNQKDRDRTLLELLKTAWERRVFETDVDFRRWLESIRVPSKFSSYT